VTAEAVAQALNHALARKRWGAPDAWEGNVNDPRTREEHGIRFNEKWVYFLPDGSRRLVYWHRYACRGVLRETPDGSVAPESGAH
jgi:hypothetical protein